MERGREAHWQSAWAQAGLARAEADPSKEKFFAIVAYPGSSGFLHVGHLRGFAYADILHRFHRMNGRAVFFPTGTHLTGLPAVTFSQKVKLRDPATVRQLEDHGVPESEWHDLEDPERAGRFLGRSYLEVFRAFGLLIDERAYITTMDEDYRSFIRWQFHRLDRAGALVQAPHFASVCPVCGPVSVDPSETDLSQGGGAEWIVYHTVPFRLDDGRFLLAATLRPETLFGATNVWVAPHATLSTWHHGTHRFLVSPEGGRRLLEQLGGHLGAEVPFEELRSTSVTVPITERKIPILTSPLVSPSIGTGVVMSVPAHAPADWVALQELPEHDLNRIPPVESVIRTDEATLTASERELLAGAGVPAERAARASGASRLADTDALDRATERLYRLELIRGRMMPGILGGISVAEARAKVGERLEAEGTAPQVREFSEPVVCRNGHTVVIERVPDQWFLRYGDPVWKEKDRTLVGRLVVRPEEYRRELPAIFEWLSDRPCTRRGRWLGTPFPKDESWVIEPIADSTFYPAYYPIRGFVASGEVPLSALTDAFFDHAILGEGSGEPSLAHATQQAVRQQFLYWYPLDLNIAGKEHKRVHFPVFVATHALLLPAALQPRGLFLHGWVTNQGGAKISKKEVASKGGSVPPLREAFRRWGPDALRLFYSASATPSQDVEWDPALLDATSERIEDLTRLARTALSEGGGGPPELERWLESRTHELLSRIVEAFGECRMRDVAEAVYAEFPLAIRRYLLRGGQPGESLVRVAETWVATMSPVTPHLAEELLDGRLPTLVAASPFPNAASFPYSAAALAAEEVVDRIEEDLRNVLKPAHAKGAAPDEAILFVAAPWKHTVEGWIREGARPEGGGPNLRDLLERSKLHPELAAYRGEMAKYIARVSASIRSEPKGSSERTDDLAILTAAQGYLTRRFRFRSISVVREEEGKPFDPLARRDRARPGRPAFYLFGGVLGPPASAARPTDPLAGTKPSTPES
ncbi:MAG: class I tRNA ligase family protein [Thermoplasmata archaeon]|nr:class I tRNA ligase family protein [Thermoplasmata archaeon]MCI4359345.1 class I tRNA ligase family protein [Thermoplasmata archaeon]